MHRPNSGPYAPRPGVTRLLLVDERVSVELVTYYSGQSHTMQGTIAGIDDYGLLIDQGSNSLVFIPWSSVRTVRKVPAQ